MRWILYKIIFFFFFLINFSVSAEPTLFQQYYQGILTEARQQNLSRDPYWRRLVHYKKSPFGTYKSEADGPLFFMSPEGRTNPEAELEATLYGFIFGDFLRPEAQHPQCRFPERFHWLDQKLKFQKDRMPQPPCEQYRAWREDVQIESISFVFASYYINNPSSMFGHTFLKFNRKGTAKNRELIDFGLNYAANPTTENPVLYAIMGIFGGFQGLYALFPYYLKVNEYNDFESRDIWEYPLVLTEEEVERTVRHTWELGSTWFDYFYFDENCSYQLLTLLEVSRPELSFSDKYFYVVQPADTVKNIVRSPGLAEQPKYRPFLYNKYMAHVQRLSDEEQGEFYKIVRKKEIPDKSLSAQSRAAVIDTYFEFHNFRYYGEQNIPGEQKEFMDRLLLARAEIGRIDNAGKFFSVLPELPTSGHESSAWRLSYVGGTLGHGAALLFRPALRELIDSPTGYSPYSQVIMFDTALRFYPQERAMPFFDFINFVDIISLSPLQRSYLRPSWAVRFGLKSLADENVSGRPDDRMTLYAEAGGGFTLSAWDRLSWFAMLQARAEASPALSDGGRLAPVLTSGVLWRLFNTTSLISRLDLRHYLFSTPVLLWHNGFNWGLGQSWALEVTGSFTVVDPYAGQITSEEISFGLKYYL